MSDVTIGLLHPGEMGAAVGQCPDKHVAPGPFGAR
jgi:hypothetical protein